MNWKNWNSPSINILHGIAVLWCFTLGLHLLFQHHRWGAALQFAVALFNVGLNVASGLIRRKTDALRAHMEAVRREAEREAAMPEVDRLLAYQKAADNLERVVKALGAEPVGIDPLHPFTGSIERAGFGIRIYLAGSEFIVLAGHIFRLNGNKEIEARTCYYGPVTEPWPENIASALLLLKQNPGVFEKWRKQDGYYLD